MGEDKNRAPLIPVSGGLAVLAALGLMLYGSQPFKADRPASPDHPEHYDKVNARLWQDPFQAVLDGGKGSGPTLTPCTISLTGSKDGEVCPCLSGKGGEGERVVVGVMVPGAPYAEDGEMRLRYRYAVLSGFARLGYYPEDAEHINFLKVAGKDTKARYSLSGIMPFERLEHRGTPERKDRVLLLWMNSALFGKDPLTKMERLAALAGVSDGSSRRKFKIIGPAESDTLKEMVKDAWRYSLSSHGESVGQRCEIYSAVATVDDRVLLTDAMDERGPAVAGHERAGRVWEAAAAEKIKDLFLRRGFTFVRTAGTDRYLARALIRELDLRGVRLTDPKKQILLVAEWDTYYGRSIERVFREELDEMLASEKKSGSGKAADARHRRGVRRISYLRGIDGRLPGGEEEEKKKDQQKGKDEAKNDQSKEKKEWERPVGKSQLDYLRRLSEETERVSETSKDDKRGEIKAVGIIGTDFYDKFLALQALRQKFFDAVYFTVDMDARYLHPDQIEWTRNLVVASNFGLSLRKEDRMDLQGEIPPFRDSYQTAVFYTILSMFADNVCRGNDECGEAVILHQASDKEREPLVFEVGRSKAVLLTDPGESIHPKRDPPCVKSWLKGLRFSWSQGKVALIALLGLAFLSFTSIGLNRFVQWFRKGRRIWILGSMILAAAAVVFAVYSISLCEWEEPFSLVEGISVWPTEILRFIALVMSWVFFALAYRDRKENSKAAAEKFDLPADPTDKLTWERFLRYMKNLVSPRAWSRQKFNQWFSGVVDLDWKPEVSEDADLRTLWRKYREHDKGIHGFWRVTIMAVLAATLTMFIISFDIPVAPAWGTITRRVDFAMVCTFLASYVILMCYVYDVTRCCRRFISIASDVFEERPKPWSDKEMNARIIEELRLIRLVADRSAAIGKFIFYPFIVWLIMLVSRTSYIDNWKMPIGLAVVISLGAVYVWVSALLMRTKGEKAREMAIGRLKGLLSDAFLTRKSSPAVRQQLSFAIQEIRSIREGAFAPLSQQPVLRVLLVPFGGLGAIYWLEYLMKLSP